MSKTRLALAVIFVLASNAALQALTVPYLEDFAADNANWKNNAGSAAGFVAAGGPDGSSFMTAPYNFVSDIAGLTPVIHRGEAGASANNFFGNWITGGVKTFSTYVRHNASVPITYFIRTAKPAGFPGFIVTDTVPVPANTWTLLEFSIDPNNPNNIPEGPMSTFGGVMADVGRVHIGAYVPAALAGVDQQFSFDLDKVSVNIPEPSSVALLLGLTALVTGRRIRQPLAIA